MPPRNKQKGYALLVLMSAVSVAVFGVGLIIPHSSLSQWRVLTQDAFQLNAERARLMEYAVDYVSLYGSSGAGPGHLPCPDTDLGGLRPGPNPPCGRSLVATGQLPDGVTRGSRRIVFTDSISGRSEYGLARSVVNNPARPIHSQHWPNEHSFDSTASGYAKLSRSSGQARLLRKHQLAKPTLNWVRAWLGWQLIEFSWVHCEKQVFTQSPMHAIDTHPVAFCPKALSPADIEDVTSLLTLDSCVAVDFICTSNGFDALVWLRDENEERWQGSAFEHHWFIKNSWFEVWQFSWHEACASRSVDCLLSTDIDDNSLRFSLLPSTPTIMPTRTPTPTPTRVLF